MRVEIKYNIKITKILKDAAIMSKIEIYPLDKNLLSKYPSHRDLSSAKLERRCHSGDAIGSYLGKYLWRLYDRREAIVVHLQRNRLESEGVSRSFSMLVMVMRDGGGGGGDETPKFVGRATPCTSMKRTHTRAERASEHIS